MSDDKIYKITPFDFLLQFARWPILAFLDYHVITHNFISYWFIFDLLYNILSLTYVVVNLIRSYCVSTTFEKWFLGDGNWWTKLDMEYLKLFSDICSVYRNTIGDFILSPWAALLMYQAWFLSDYTIWTCLIFKLIDHLVFAYWKGSKYHLDIYTSKFKRNQIERNTKNRRRYNKRVMETKNRDLYMEQLSQVERVLDILGKHLNKNATETEANHENDSPTSDDDETSPDQN